MAKILLLGCGNLGRKLAIRLIAAKHTVIAVKRTALKTPVTGLQLVLADITVAQTVKKIPTNVDIVILLLSPSERNKAAYQNLYGQGLLNVLSHFTDSTLVASGTRPRWLFVSSTSVYGQNSGEWVDEESPTQAMGFNGRALVQAEQQLWAHCAESTVLRFSGIYGRGREGLIRRVRDAKPVQYDPPYYSNRIHEDDCLGVLVFLIHRSLSGMPLDNLYVATDSAAVPLSEVALWLSETIGCPAPPKKEGCFTMPEMNKRCRNDRLLKLGYSLRYRTYKDGYKAVLE
jgi:nucleoside-diphosphate-sugar epimerase